MRTSELFKKAVRLRAAVVVATVVLCGPAIAGADPVLDWNAIAVKPASLDPGVWQLTPGCPAAGGVFLNWQHVVPFGIENAEDFRAAAPPALTSARYTKDYDEVKRVGSLDSVERPQDRTDVAKFYAS